MYKITSEPSELLDVFCSGGSTADRYPINQNPSAEYDINKANFTQGFPPVTRLAELAGGLPPYGQDFNGILYILSKYLFYLQSGGSFSWSAERDYIKNCIILASDNSFYIAKEPSGPNYGGAVDPVAEGQTAWARQSVATGIPVGMIFPMWGDSKPDNSGQAKFIELTAGKAIEETDYNYNLLTDENITNDTGQFAIFTNATAVISFTASPLAGQTVRLINTEKRYLRAGNSLTMYNDAIRNIIGTTKSPCIDDVATNTGAIYQYGWQEGQDFIRQGGNWGLGFDASRVVPIANENRVRTLELTYFMRIA